mmetsp:Transcript_14278/g.24243  ORF Transcript_14278/g.24243 Transcript_14278/m.24243 type:complete len:116 (-) Transcript_14278:1021-1368(-)
MFRIRMECPKQQPETHYYYYSSSSSSCLCNTPNHQHPTLGHPTKIIIIIIIRETEREIERTVNVSFCQFHSIQNNGCVESRVLMSARPPVTLLATDTHHLLHGRETLVKKKFETR